MNPCPFCGKERVTVYNDGPPYSNHECAPSLRPSPTRFTPAMYILEAGVNDVMLDEDGNELGPDGKKKP